MFTTLPIFFKENLKLDEFWIGAVMAINGVLIALVEMPLVFVLERRLPYLFLITVGTVLLGIAFVVLNLPLTNGLLIAIVAILVITFAEMLAMPFMNSYYISKSNEHTRGQYAGMYTMAWSAAQVIGSSSGSLLAQQLGFYNLWWITAAVCLVAACGFYYLRKKTSHSL